MAPGFNFFLLLSEAINWVSRKFIFPHKCWAKQTLLANRSVCTDVFLNHSHIFVIFLRNSVSLAANKCDARDEQHKKVRIINGLALRTTSSTSWKVFRRIPSERLYIIRLSKVEKAQEIPSDCWIFWFLALTDGQPDKRSTKWLNRALCVPECPRKQKIISE